MTDRIDQAVFRQAMAMQASAVTIVTTDGAHGRHGLTATAVCSVTDAPATLLVCVNRSSRSYEAFVGNGALCVNILSEAHKPLAMHFGASGLSGEERFALGDWTSAATGAPVLREALASLDCRIASASQVGTHAIFLCEIRDIALSPGTAALVYWNREFHGVPLSQTAVHTPACA